MRCDLYSYVVPSVRPVASGALGLRDLGHGDWASGNLSHVQVATLVLVEVRPEAWNQQMNHCSLERLMAGKAYAKGYVRGVCDLDACGNVSWTSSGRLSGEGLLQ